jgi:TonB family protein
MRSRLRTSLYLFILLSLLIHVGFWSGLHLSKTPDFLTKKDKIEITVLDQSQADKILQQIVEQNEKPINDEIPEDAKFLSAKNQRVVKETRAQKTGDFRNSAGKGMDTKPAEEMAQKPATQSKVTRGTLPMLSDLRPKFDPTTSQEVKKNTGSGGPVSQTNDFIKDTNPSLETLLSTREFVYYTYYQRIRAQIRQFWEPSIREKVKRIFATGRTIASEHDHITRVIIILDKNGNLMRVQVIGESGLKDLDDAAVEAFRAAEPFPNPPKGIVDKDGTIKINWDFVLEASNDGPINSQRYARSN